MLRNPAAQKSAHCVNETLLLTTTKHTHTHIHTGGANGSHHNHHSSPASGKRKEKEFPTTPNERETWFLRAFARGEAEQRAGTAPVASAANQLNCKPSGRLLSDEQGSLASCCTKLTICQPPAPVESPYGANYTARPTRDTGTLAGANHLAH